MDKTKFIKGSGICILRFKFKKTILMELKNLIDLILSDMDFSDEEIAISYFFNIL